MVNSDHLVPRPSLHTPTISPCALPQLFIPVQLWYRAAAGCILSTLHPISICGAICHLILALVNVRYSNTISGIKISLNRS